MEDPCCDISLLLYLHPTSFTLRPLGALGSVVVVDIQGRQWYQHIKAGAPLVGGVSLLQDDHGVPDASVE